MANLWRGIDHTPIFAKVCHLVWMLIIAAAESVYSRRLTEKAGSRIPIR